MVKSDAERLLAYVDKEGTYTVAALKTAISIKIGSLILQLQKNPSVEVYKELEQAKEDFQLVASLGDGDYDA